MTKKKQEVMPKYFEFNGQLIPTNPIEYIKYRRKFEADMTKKVIQEIINDEVNNDTYPEDGYPSEPDFNPSKPTHLLIWSSRGVKVRSYYNFLKKYKQQFTPKEYWYGLRNAYSESDFLFPDKKNYFQAFQRKI